MELQERLDKFLSKTPQTHPSAFIAQSAELIGDVRIGENSSVWPKCVLRADINSISIGTGTNLQDGTIVHLADDYPVSIGNHVTIGHGAMIHACTIENECLIGMRATILDGAVIGARSIIGAGALVSKDTIVPSGSLVLGVPGKVARILSNEEQNEIAYWAKKYVKLAQAHKTRGT